MEGIVVRVHASGESDAVVRVITRGHGKVSLFAPKVRKSRRRFGTAIDILDWGVFQTAPSRGALPIIQSFTPRSSFPHLRSNFEKMALATFICEAFDAMLAEDAVENEEVFENLQLCLQAIDESAELKTALRSCYLALANLLRWCGTLNQAEEPSANALLRLASKVENFTQRKLATKEQLHLVIDTLRKSSA